MSLIEQRVGALSPEVTIVLWQQQRLQVGRIIDRMGPGIRSEELEVPRKALLEIDSHSVVVRVAVRNLRIDRAKRRDDARCSQRAAGSQRAIGPSRRDGPTCKRLDEEVVRRARAEEIGCRRSNDSTASGD